MDRGPWRATVMGSQRVRNDLVTEHEGAQDEKGLVSRIQKLRSKKVSFLNGLKILMRHFSKEGTELFSKHMKWCLVALTIRELDVKSESGMAVITEADSNKCW